MKTITCNQLGGACDLAFHADTFESMAAHNSTGPKGGTSYSAGTFVQAESSVLRIKFSVKNPALRVAAKPYSGHFRMAHDKLVINGLVKW